MEVCFFLFLFGLSSLFHFEINSRLFHCFSSYFFTCNTLHISYYGFLFIYFYVFVLVISFYFDVPRETFCSCFSWQSRFYEFCFKTCFTWNNSFYDDYLKTFLLLPAIFQWIMFLHVRYIYLKMKTHCFKYGISCWIRYCIFYWISCE